MKSIVLKLRATCAPAQTLLPTYTKFIVYKVIIMFLLPFESGNSNLIADELKNKSENVFVSMKFKLRGNDEFTFVLIRYANA